MPERKDQIVDPSPSRDRTGPALSPSPRTKAFPDLSAEEGHGVRSSTYVPDDPDSLGLGRSRSLILARGDQGDGMGRTGTSDFAAVQQIERLLQSALSRLPAIDEKDDTPHEQQVLSLVRALQERAVAETLPPEICAGVRSLIMLLLASLGREELIRNKLAEFREVLCRLQREATIDSLTGLWNQNAAKKYFPDIFRHCRMNGIPLTAVILDLDNFHSLNEEHGHDGGDEILRDLAALLKAIGVSENVVIARYGQGEEFCILFVGHSPEEAMQALEDLRDNAQRSNVRFGEKALKYTFSAGVFMANFAKIVDIKHLIHFADQALFEAKAKGKNVVVNGQFCDGTVKYAPHCDKERFPVPGRPRERGEERKPPSMSLSVLIKLYLAQKFPSITKAAQVYFDARMAKKEKKKQARLAA